MIRIIIIGFLLLSSLHNIFASKKAELIADIQDLLSSEPSVDYEDPKLKKILNKYNYRLFKTYKAFIEFDKSNKTKADLLKAKAILRILSKDPKWLWSQYWESHELNEENIIFRFFELLSHYRIADDMLEILPEEKKNWDEHYRYKYFKVPLWLALKYPDNLRATNGPYDLIVNAKKSVRNIEEFNKFLSLIAGVHGGFWSNNFGEERFDSYLITKHFIDVISFNPILYIKRDLTSGPCAKQSIQERFSIFVRWSNKSKKNMLKYNKILLYFDKASKAIEDYYKSNYNLGKYAPYTKDILSHYICEHVSALLE